MDNIATLFPRAKRRVGKTKYLNVTSECSSGHLHDSEEEASYCDDLHVLKKIGEIHGIEIQKSFDFIVNGVLICRHVVDFYVNRYGKYSVHEVKMPMKFCPKDYPIKHKLFLALFPDIPYFLIEKEKWQKTGIYNRYVKKNNNTDRSRNK